MQKIVSVILAVVLMLTLSGCKREKVPTDLTFTIDPVLESEFSDIGDFLREIEDHIGHVVLIEHNLFRGTVNVVDGVFMVHALTFRSDSIYEDVEFGYRDEDYLRCSDTLEGFDCEFYYNFYEDFTYLDQFVTIAETIEFIDLVDISELETLNEITWNLDMFMFDYMIEFDYSDFDDHEMDFDFRVSDFSDTVYTRGLYEDGEFITTGQQVLDGVYFEVTFSSSITNEILILYFSTDLSKHRADWM